MKKKDLIFLKKLNNEINKINNKYGQMDIRIDFSQEECSRLNIAKIIEQNINVTQDRVRLSQSRIKSREYREYCVDLVSVALDIYGGLGFFWHKMRKIEGLSNRNITALKRRDEDKNSNIYRGMYLITLIPIVVCIFTNGIIQKTGLILSMIFLIITLASNKGVS